MHSGELLPDEGSARPELDALLWRAMTNRRSDTLELWTPDDDQNRAGDTLAPAPAVESTVDPASIPPKVIQACLDRHGGRQEPV
jgi:hypothetical protein